MVIFNENLGRVAEQYLKKGAKVYIEGQLQTRKWTDQSGPDKYSTEIVLQGFRWDPTILDSRGGGGSRNTPRRRAAARSAAAAISGRSSPMERRPAPAAASGGGGSRYNDLDDDIPF